DLHAPIFRGRLEAASWGLLLPTTRKVCVRCLLTFSLVNVLQVNNQLTFTCVCVVGSHFSVDSANPTSDLLPALVAAHNNPTQATSLAASIVNGAETPGEASHSAALSPGRR